MKINKLLVSIILLLSIRSIQALPDTLSFKMNNISVHKLTSLTNHIPYHLNVYLPQNYNTTKQDYSVIYLLDADYSFLIAK